MDQVIDWYVESQSVMLIHRATASYYYGSGFERNGTFSNPSEEKRVSDSQRDYLPRIIQIKQHYPN